MLTQLTKLLINNDTATGLIELPGSHHQQRDLDHSSHPHHQCPTHMHYQQH